MVAGNENDCQFSRQPHYGTLASNSDRSGLRPPDVIEEMDEYGLPQGSDNPAHAQETVPKLIAPPSRLIEHRRNPASGRASPPERWHNDM